eukprot:scaffold212094_cov40-Tisochrysis_lutea.AAC.3
MATRAHCAFAHCDVDECIGLFDGGSDAAATISIGLQEHVKQRHLPRGRKAWLAINRTCSKIFKAGRCKTGKEKETDRSCMGDRGWERVIRDSSTLDTQVRRRSDLRLAEHRRIV